MHVQSPQFTAGTQSEQRFLSNPKKKKKEHWKCWLNSEENITSLMPLRVWSPIRKRTALLTELWPSRVLNRHRWQDGPTPDNNTLFVTCHGGNTLAQGHQGTRKTRPCAITASSRQQRVPWSRRCMHCRVHVVLYSVFQLFFYFSTWLLGENEASASNRIQGGYSRCYCQKCSINNKMLRQIKHLHCISVASLMVVCVCLPPWPLYKTITVIP